MVEPWLAAVSINSPASFSAKVLPAREREFAMSERIAAHAGNLDGHLQGRTADAARLDFEAGTRIPEGRLKDFERRLFHFFFDDAERIIDKALRRHLFATFHHAVYELRDDETVIFRIRINAM